MIRLTALLTAAALAVPLGTPLLAQEPQRGGVAGRSERPAAEERARGEGQGGQRRPEAAPASRRLPPDSITQHTLELPGRSLRFTATAGSLPVVDQGGQLQAEIGVASYTLNGAEPGTRPVAFALNGGPGAASAYLHLLVLGPWRLPLDRDRARAQRRDLARFHRPRLHRPGRYRLQPRRRLLRGHPQPLLQHRGRRRHAFGGDHAVAQAEQPPDLAEIPYRRELWRLSRAAHRARAAEGCRRRPQRHGDAVAGARLRLVQPAAPRAVGPRRAAAVLCRRRDGG